MQKTINPFLITAMLLITLSIQGQNSTNSPYTRYGYGDLANRSFGAGRSMGGVGIGLRSAKQINPMNPASYSSMDSLTFLFDFGASAQMSWYSDGVNKQNDINGNVEYMAMQFPLSRRIALSAGLMPFSHVGYAFGEINTANGQTYSEKFEGTGGLNQLYGGLSIDIWRKRLAIGANINYLFGAVQHNTTVAYSAANSTSIYSADKLIIKDAMFDFGIQYTQPVNKTDNIVLGLVYSPGRKLNNEYYRQVTGTETVVDTITGLTFDYPESYGIGLSYSRENKFIAVADVSLQSWKDATYASEKNVFNDRMKISAGGEFIPNLYSCPYLNRMRYRLGASYTGSYIKVGDNGYKEYSATIGVGFPVTDDRSFVNLSLEYVKIAPDAKQMIDESYLRLTLNYTFNEYWFFKLKLK